MLNKAIALTVFTLVLCLNAFTQVGFDAHGGVIIMKRTDLAITTTVTQKSNSGIYPGSKIFIEKKKGHPFNLNTEKIEFKTNGSKETHTVDIVLYDKTSANTDTLIFALRRNYACAIGRDSLLTVIVLGVGVSVEEVEAKQEVLTYPNPATERVYFNTPAEILSSTIEIYSIEGQRVATENFNGYIDIASYNSGKYFVYIKNENSLFTSSFIKQ